MKNILDVYAEYKLMPQLKEHMFRVAAVASMICDSMNVPTDKDNLILACLLHDMGNIVKFKLDYFPEFIEPEGLAYWQGIQNEFIAKYGNEEHQATNSIIKEIGVGDRVALLANQNRFTMLCAHSNISDINTKIIHYADMRVGPKGIMSYDERMLDAKERYKNDHNGIMEIERQKLVACGKEIENQIFAQSKIKPEDITDEAIAPIVESLKSFVLK